jgi:hypothetical protein
VFSIFFISTVDHQHHHHHLSSQPSLYIGIILFITTNTTITNTNICFQLELAHTKSGGPPKVGAGPTVAQATAVHYGAPALAITDGE